MTTAIEARQTLIDALQALFDAATPADNVEQRATRIAAALTMLEGSQTLEGVVVATVQAAKDTIIANGANSVTAINSANSSLNNAITSFGTATTSTNDTNTKVTAIQPVVQTTSNVVANTNTIAADIQTKVTSAKGTSEATNTIATDVQTKVTSAKATVETTANVVANTNTIVANTSTIATDVQSKVTSVKTTVESNALILSTSSGRSRLGFHQTMKPITITQSWSTYTDYYCDTFGIRASIFDDRNDTLYTVYETPTRDGANTTLTLRSYKNDVSTVLHTTNWTNGGNNSSTGGLMSVYLLPLARSASDSTTVISMIVLNMAASTGVNSAWSTAQIYNADNWTTNRPITNKPKGPVGHGYDFTNKTFLAVSGTGGTLPYDTSVNPVREYFADATTRDLTPPSTPHNSQYGCKGLMNLAAADPVRYFLFSYASPLAFTVPVLNRKYRVMTSNQELVAGASNTSAYDDYCVLSEFQAPNQNYSGYWDGSFKRRAYSSSQLHHTYWGNTMSATDFILTTWHYYIAQGLGYRCPQWAISSTGAVDLWHIRYVPQFEIFNVGTYTSNARVYNDYGVTGVKFAVENSLGQTVRTGELSTRSEQSGMRFRTPSSTKVMGDISRHIGMMVPLAYNPITEEMLAFTGMKYCQDVISTNTGEYYAYESATTLYEMPSWVSAYKML